MIKRFAALLLLVALAGMLVAGNADAHRRRGKKHKPQTVGVSNVTIDWTDQEPSIPLPILFEDLPDYFSGSISRVKGCDGHQTVEVIRAGGGIVGTVQAANNGDWTIEAEDPGNDTYFAKVTGFPMKNSHHACTRGTSALLTVEDA
jgi:hypothetical protein